MNDDREALAALLPCEDPEEPCDQDGRDEHRWCDNCIARAAITRAGVTLAPSLDEGLDVERLAAAIHLNWYEIRPSGGMWVRPGEAAVAIAREYRRLAQEGETPTSDPRPKWSIERGDGWTTFERTRPEVRVLTESRACHIHFWTSDDEMDAQGWAMTDLVCHGCGHALRFIYPTFTDDAARNEPFRPMRDAFVHDHRQHWALANDILCPPTYSITETRDLRLAQEGETPT